MFTSEAQEQKHDASSVSSYEHMLSACLVQSKLLRTVLPAKYMDVEILWSMYAWRHSHAEFENQPCWSARGIVRGQEPQRL